MQQDIDSLLSFPMIAELNKQFKAEHRCEDLTTLFIEMDTLGSGSFGKVKRVQSKNTQEMFALKFLTKSQISELKLWTQLRNEIRILLICNHPSIIKINAVYEDPKNIILVMELFNGKTLFQHLVKKRRL